jgi:hypothetical protein
VESDFGSGRQPTDTTPVKMVPYLTRYDPTFKRLKSFRPQRASHPAPRPFVHRNSRPFILLASAANSHKFQSSYRGLASTKRFIPLSLAASARHRSVIKPRLRLRANGSAVGRAVAFGLIRSQMHNVIGGVA